MYTATLELEKFAYDVKYGPRLDILLMNGCWVACEGYLAIRLWESIQAHEEQLKRVQEFKAGVENGESMTHGVNCPKAPHSKPTGGYLHAADDDTPYDVDGCSYCGRCHYAL